MKTTNEILRALGETTTTDLARALDKTQRALRYHDQLFGRLHNLIVAPTASNRAYGLALLNKIRAEIAS